MPTSQVRPTTSQVGDTDGKLLNKPIRVANAIVNSRRRPGCGRNIGAVLVVMGVISTR